MNETNKQHLEHDGIPLLSWVDLISQERYDRKYMRFWNWLFLWWTFTPVADLSYSQLSCWAQHEASHRGKGGAGRASPSCGELQWRCLTKLLQKFAGSEWKTSFPLGKVFSAVLCPSFNAKKPSNFDKTAATAAFTLIFIAAAVIYSSRSVVFFTFFCGAVCGTGFSLFVTT